MLGDGDNEVNPGGSFAQARGFDDGNNELLRVLNRLEALENMGRDGEDRPAPGEGGPSARRRR